MKKDPGGRAFLICLLQIKIVGVYVYWYHILGIEFYYIEVRIFFPEASNGSTDKINSDILAIIHTLNYLNIFSVSMPVEANSYNMLIPI